MKIKSVHAREILDSRGNPTVEVVLFLVGGAAFGRAAVPSGASTGTHEAHELRDGDKKRYGGKGVLKAVENVNEEIAKAVVGMDADNQKALDTRMIAIDGTPNKGRLGANAILAVSLAAAHAAAHVKGVPLHNHIRALSSEPREPILPLPMVNIINGGAHAAGSTDIQEFMIMPVGSTTFRDGIRMCAEIFHSLKRVLQGRGYGTTVGDEGGFAPAVRRGNREALELIAEAVKDAKYDLGRDIVLALDVAATELKEGSSYILKTERTGKASREMISWYETLAKDFPIASIEDGLAEDDWEGWRVMNVRLGSKMQLVGDDIFVTNPEFLKRGIEERAANAILIKVNQIGTLTETITAVDLAHKNGWKAIISHRSGETEDTTIAHLAVGLGTGQIKTGSTSRTDRVAKYNELLRIEESRGAKARFAGKDALG